MATHGKCGKTIPGGERGGHCNACHENFIGLSAFEHHRVGEHGVNRHCEFQPYETTDPDTGKTKYGHWQDDNGNWRYGRKLTKDERDRIFNARSQP